MNTSRQCRASQEAWELKCLSVAGRFFIHRRASQEAWELKSQRAHDVLIYRPSGLARGLGIEISCTRYGRRAYPVGPRKRPGN